MIASLTGTVTSVRLTSAVLSVGGLGMEFAATPTTLAALREGQEATVATSLVVREDSMSLYGFSDRSEKDTFDILLTVSGVGPRLALAMLAVHSPDALATAVANEDLAALQRVNGIGKKSAQRIVLELGERLGPATAPEQPATQPPAAMNPDVSDALVNLGWTTNQAEAALAAVGTEGQDAASVLRAALQYLGGHRG